MPKGSRSVTPGKLRERLEGYTVDMLKPMVKLLASNLPTRKPRLVALIHSALMDPDRQRQLWASMDATQQAALAEAVHSPEGQLDAEHFRAKYGRDPYWGEFSPGAALKRPPPCTCLFRAERYRPTCKPGSGPLCRLRARPGSRPRTLRRR